MSSAFKHFADPVHGFISVPRGPLLSLIDHPIVQRLRRIKQLGLGHLVFPSAEHTRFGHALGVLGLMHDAIENLRNRGFQISEDEGRAALATALLHDIGHGPFSHTLEHVLFPGISHEVFSLRLMKTLEVAFPDTLSLAVSIFTNHYDRPFLHQLVSSQLDVDRLDYLRRDAFFTGVAEGQVGTYRIIHTMTLSDNEKLCIEAKGVPVVENYLVARRLMYWQVYLHKTVLAGDFLLRQIVYRAREVCASKDYMSRPLEDLLTWAQNPSAEVSDHMIEAYIAIDDLDLLVQIKRWSTDATDVVLKTLSSLFIQRRFPKVRFLDAAVSEESIQALLHDARKKLPSTLRNTPHHLIAVEQTHHRGYRQHGSPIQIRDHHGDVWPMESFASGGIMSALSQIEQKQYIVMPS